MTSEEGLPKLLAVSTSYFPTNGGQEIGLLRILRSLEGRYRTAVATPRYESVWARQETMDGIPVHRYNSCLLRRPSRILPVNWQLGLEVVRSFVFLPPLLRSLRPDVALVHFLTPCGLPAARALRRLGVPFAVYLGGSAVDWAGRLIEKANGRALKLAPKILSCSRFLGRDVVNRFGLDAGKVEVIPYGVPLALYRSQPKSFASELRLLCVQRLVAVKGTRFLILALSQLLREGIRGWTLDIVGDGPERPELERLSRELGLSQTIRFQGNLDNRHLPELYQKSHVFVLPTLWEGQGIVLLEAMATNNIILASDCTAVPETIRDGENGLLFRPGQTQDLSRLLARVIRRPADFAHLAEQALKDVQRYDLPLVAERMRGALESLRPKAPAGRPRRPTP